MIHIFHTKGPHHTHDCEECEYLFSRRIDGSNKTVEFDFYRSCTDEDKETFLIRFSSDGPDYYSGVTVENALIHYAIDMQGIDM